MAVKKNPIQYREDIVEEDAHCYKHQPKNNNALRIKLDHLRTYDALTPNQSKLFEMYKMGEYCIGVLGSAGSGKCQGEDVEVNLLVSDELYEHLIKMS